MASESTIVLITGANSGIGYATAQVLASADAKYHVIMASRSSSKGEAAAAAVRAAPGIKGTISTIELDVNNPTSIQAAAKRIETYHDRLDVLINNAGIYSKAPTLKEQLEATFATNVTGAALVTQEFTPLLRNSSHPYVLHISSGLGSLDMAADPQSSIYSFDGYAYRMSKAALNMLALQDVKLLGRQGVKVFAVCPGLVESGLRGHSEQERSAGGRAGDPKVSGETILSILEGKRDEDVGKFVHKDGVYPW